MYHIWAVTAGTWFVTRIAVHTSVYQWPAFHLPPAKYRYDCWISTSLKQKEISGEFSQMYPNNFTAAVQESLNAHTWY